MLLLGILAAFASCKGANASAVANNAIHSDIETGDTVNALGDHLWYVYQDKKDNYWFGSNGEGYVRVSLCADETVFEMSITRISYSAKT